MTAPRRLVTVALALGAAALAAIGVQAGRWWVAGEVAIGPRFADLGGEWGRRTGLGWLDGSPAWARTGLGSFGAGLVLALCSLLLAAAAAAGGRTRLLARTELVAATTASIVGVMFVTGFPGLAGAEVGRGLVFYFLSVGLGLAAGVCALLANSGPARRV